MSGHAKLSPSASKRWFSCPGSIRESEGIESPSSAFAEEGTQAHELCANVLMGVRPKGELDDAMKQYVEHVVSLDHYKADLLVEVPVSCAPHVPEVYGTADAIVWRPDEQTLYVVDLKYGAGVPVEAVDNTQLKIYALASLVTMGYPARRIVATIVQPRCYHPDGPVRSVDYTAVDLAEFCLDLVEYAAATRKPDAALHPGDHCRWCPAAFRCPALKQRAQEVAKFEFSGVKPYDPAELALSLESIPVLETWIKAVREFAYREAEAGRCPPGWKLVEKRATRQWRSEGEMVEWAQTVGVDPYDKKPVSPAELERRVQNKEDKAAIEALVTKVSSGLTLAPEDSKRPAAKRSAADDFAGV